MVRTNPRVPVCSGTPALVHIFLSVSNKGGPKDLDLQGIYPPAHQKYVLTKGQLISKGLFGILNSSKKRTKTIRPEVS